ncbi:MAG: hypothetical protein DI547_13675 [Sphingobium sp.]|nr:MAG: hypothetical protein DI547_13675 [Sphingobium sp.]
MHREAVGGRARFRGKGRLRTISPFALSLSKGNAEHSEVPSLRSGERFDRLGPNGAGRRFQ